MKKIVTAIALLFLVCSINAQDTIMYGNTNYMYPFSPDISWFVKGYIVSSNTNPDGVRSVVYYCDGVTNVPMYGIGVMLPSLGVTDIPDSHLYDVDIDNEDRVVFVCRLFDHFDTVGLELSYVEFLDTLRYENLCRKHIVAVPIQYDFYFQPCQEIGYYVMYDYRFDAPMMINDDTLAFYTGYNLQRSQICLTAYNDYNRSHLNGIVRINGTGYARFMDSTISQYCSYIEDNASRYYNGHYRNDIPAIFPILQPIEDTTGQGGDTTAVDMVDGVGRYVSLTPNPAADRVQVLSSFGLKQVEAYNAEGKLVYADEAHGLSKTIDLAAWPRGIYLVRIITPMGSTTKKLVLR